MEVDNKNTFSVSNLIEKAEKLVENLKTNHNLFVDKDDRLCWKDCKSWTGQKETHLKKAIVDIWDKNEKKSWQENRFSDVAISLRLPFIEIFHVELVDVKKNIDDFSEIAKKNLYVHQPSKMIQSKLKEKFQYKITLKKKRKSKKILIVVMTEKGEEDSCFERTGILGKGNESKVIRAKSTKMMKECAVKITKTLSGVAKFKLSSKPIKKEHLKRMIPDYLKKNMKNSLRYTSLFSNNLVRQEKIIREINPFGKLSGMLSPSEAVVPIVHVIKEYLDGTPEVSWMRCEEVYDKDAGELSIKKWSFKHLLHAYKNLLNTLKSVHEKNLFLGDIKPPNILMNKEKHLLCFADFSSSSEIYTPGYVFYDEYKLFSNMKTENQIIAGQRIDIFGLGVSFYEMMTGLYLFLDQVEDEKFEDRKYTILNDLKLSVRREDQKYIEDLTEIISLMCHPDYLRRPTATEALKLFEELLSLISD